MSFVEEYERLKLDNDRKNAFGHHLVRGVGVLSVFNTNIKTLGTIQKYSQYVWNTAYPTDDAGK